MSRFLIGFGLCTVFAAAVPSAEPPSLKDALALQEALQNAIQDAEPAIACIMVSRSEAYRQIGQEPPAAEDGVLGRFARPPNDGGAHAKLDMASPSYVPESYGSGVVIDDKGLILTNYHVVRDATKIYVRLPGRKGSYADIHAADHRSDLAVLRVLDPIGPFKPIKIGDGGKVKKGTMVLSLANPFAAGFRDGSPSASWGIISNLRRRSPGPVKEEERSRALLHTYGTLLQTDARLNLGCSGGALIDLKGELIGLTTSLAAITGSETAGGFAVPLDADMRRIIDVLKQGKEVEYGFLGVSIEQESRIGKGVRIKSTSPGSPAFRAGLRDFDTVLSVNGTPLSENDDLFLTIGIQLAGSQVRIEVLRAGTGAIQTIPVTLAKFYVPGKNIVSSKSPAVRGLRVDYTSVLMLSARFFGEIPGGVYIREVLPNSAAESANLKVNEVITEVNGRPIGTPADFYREAGKPGPLELRIHHRRVPVKLN